MNRPTRTRSVGLRHRLAIGFGILILLIAAGFAISELQLRTARGDLQALIGDVGAVKLVSHVELDVLRADSEAGKFIRDGVAEHAKAADASLAKADATIEELLAVDGEWRAVYAEDVTSARAVLGRYREMLAEIVAVQERRGLTENDGLQGQFRRAVHAIEESVKAQGLSELTVLMLMARRHEKDYMLRGDKKYVDRIDERIAEFDERLELYGVAEVSREEMRAQWAEYRKGVEALVEADDELREKATAFQSTAGELLAVLAGSVERVESAVRAEQEHAAAALRRTEVVLLAVLVVSILLGAVVSSVVIRSITRPVAVLAAASRRIAEGNLRRDEGLHDLAGQGHEMGQLAATFVVMVDNLAAMVRDLRDGVGNLSGSTSEILATSQQSASTAAEQAATVSQVTTTAEEIRQTGTAAADSAGQVLETSEKALRTGHGGMEKVREAESTMEVIGQRVSDIAEKMLLLSEQNNQIGEIVNQVNALTEQSNLLAVNASIEAAKAGDQGRSFAVVASEVRDLAEQSKRSTEQIRSILEDIQKATQTAVMATEEGTKRVVDGREAMGAVSHVIAELGQVLEENADRARQIAGATQEQSVGITEISRAMEAVSQATSDASGGARELERAVTDLNSLARRLDGAIERYTM